MLSFLKSHLYLKYTYPHETASAMVSPSKTVAQQNSNPKEEYFEIKGIITAILTICSNICEKDEGEALRRAIK